jgi:spore maturation protein CgeB
MALSIWLALIGGICVVGKLWAMGCGALMLADVGNYPAYMEDGKNMITYSNVDDMVNKIAWFLDHEAERREIAQSGTTMLVQHYSKECQWNDFVSLL